MAGFNKVALPVTYSRNKVERDYISIRTRWQGDSSIKFVVGQTSQKVMALKVNEAKPNRYDVVAEAWLSATGCMETRRNMQMVGLADDTLPIVREALVQKFSPEPALSFAIAH